MITTATPDEAIGTSFRAAMRRLFAVLRCLCLMAHTRFLSAKSSMPWWQTPPAPYSTKTLGIAVPTPLCSGHLQTTCQE